MNDIIYHKLQETDYAKVYDCISDFRVVESYFRDKKYYKM